MKGKSEYFIWQEFLAIEINQFTYLFPISLIRAGLNKPRMPTNRKRTIERQ